MDTVACMSVNDAFVMSRWIKSLDAADKVTMLGDGGGVFAEESGLNVKTGKFGGIRLQRLAMIVRTAVVIKSCESVVRKSLELALPAVGFSCSTC